MVADIQRKLTTIFAADVAGYSRMMGEDEPGTMAALRECRELTTGIIERHRGRVVSWSGDGVLAEFGSVVESVQCAVEIQRELAVRNERKDDGRRMEFRIGINLGDVMVEGDDIFGEGVNIAARLQTLAPTGGILISGSVYEQVRNKLALSFEAMGERSVKNIADPVRVFRVDGEGIPKPRPAARMPQDDPAGTATLIAPSARRDGADEPGTPRPARAWRRLAAAIADYAALTVVALPVLLVVNSIAPDTVEMDWPMSIVSSDTVLRELPVAAPNTTELGEGATASREERRRFLVQRTVMGIASHHYVHTEYVTRLGSETGTIELGEEIRVDVPGGLSFSGSDIDLVDPETLAPIHPWESGDLVFLLLPFMWAGFESLRGAASPGKRLMGLRVLQADGARIGFARALGRNLAKIVSVLTIGIGFLMAFWTRRKQALHDMMSECVVVQDR